MTCIAILGTSSNCGKSVITSLICRLLYKKGLRVTPFKPQNMSLNSTSTWYGEEIAYIQYIQAKICNVEATSHTNPILIKPYEVCRSEIIVLGRPRFFVEPSNYYANLIEKLRDIVQLSYRVLSGKYDVIVMEGAGCAYEPNLAHVDIANLEIPSKFDDVKIVLVADIYEGGAFASLYGTYTLLPKKVKDKVVGFIINKFCGDAKLLEPAIEWIEKKTGKKVLAILPLNEELNIFPEDSASLSKMYNPTARIDVAVIYYPYISNFGEFALLAHHQEISIRFIHKPSELGEPDLIVLPGCRNTFKALEYMRKTGLDKKLKSIAGTVPIVGICAGYQILSKRVSDPVGVETGLPIHVKGLELLDVEFTYSKYKKVARVKAKYSEDSNIEVEGFEIHRGKAINNNDKHMYIIRIENTRKVERIEGSINEKLNIYGTHIHESLLSTELLSRIVNRNIESKDMYKIMCSKLDRYLQYVQEIYDLTIPT